MPAEDLGSPPDKNFGPTGQVIHRRPQLAGRSHGHRVVRRLFQHGVDVGVDGQALGVGRFRQHRGAAHTEWLPDLAAEDLGERRRAAAGDELRPVRRNRDSSSGSVGPAATRGPGVEASRPPGRETACPPCAPTTVPASRPADQRCGKAAGRRSPAVQPAPAGGRRSGRSTRRAPSSRSRSTAAATNVLVIEPIRYCVSADGEPPPAIPVEPRPLHQMRAPSRTRPTTSEGSRPLACSSSTRRSS